MDALELADGPRTPSSNKVFPVLMPPRPLSIEVDSVLEKEAAVLSPTGPRTRSPSVTPLSRMPSPTAEELLLREHMDQLMLDVASKSQENGLSLEDAFPDDAARVTSSELAAFLSKAGVESAADTADKMIHGCKKYLGDKTPMSPVELSVHTLKQALRVAVAKSLRPRSRSSCHSSPSTSRLTSPSSIPVANTPTLGLIEENPQPLQTSPATRKKLGKTRFGKSPNSVGSQQRNPVKAPRGVDENRPISPIKEVSKSPPRGLLQSRSENDGQLTEELLQRKASKEGSIFGSPPKQPFAEFRDLNSKPLPGFISQVAVTASAKLHLAAGPSAQFGNGTQRILTWGGGGRGRGGLSRYGLEGEGGRSLNRKKTNRRKYRQVPGSETVESADRQSQSEAPSSEAADGVSKTPPLSPLNLLIKAMSLTSLWQRDSPKAEETAAEEVQSI